MLTLIALILCWFFWKDLLLTLLEVITCLLAAVVKAIKAVLSLAEDKDHKDIY